MGIQRLNNPKSLTLTNDATTSPALNFSVYSGGMIHIPTGSSITSLTFYVSDTNVGDSTPTGGSITTQVFEQLYDDTNTAVSRTVAGPRAYRLPLELFAAAAVRVVIGGVASGAVRFSLKA